MKYIWTNIYYDSLVDEYRMGAMFQSEQEANDASKRAIMQNKYLEYLKTIQLPYRFPYIKVKV